MERSAAPGPADRPARALDAIFRPRSVAVIGASRRRGSIGGEIFHNLLTSGFTGAVYPVNPGTEVIQAVRAFPRVEDIPGHVDLAVIVVPKAAVRAAVEACGRKGVRGLIIISAGFGETGPEGRALEQECLAIARRHGMRMVGPNCLGVINTDPSVGLNATFAPTWPPHGAVAFSSQSGALGLAILDLARDLGLGVTQFVSVGNKADVSGNDLIEYWEDDPATKVILLYLESFGNPRNFMRIAGRASRKKPIVAVKSGRTEAGARAASSHTGAMAGLDVAVDAILGQAGVIRTDTIEELFDVAMLLANQPAPEGPNVAILTNAGGPGIMASDACESRGLRVPSLLPATEAALRAFLPPEASVRNPVDMIASAPADAFARALPILLGDASIHAVIVLFVPPVVTEAAAVAQAIRCGAHGSGKPVLTCFLGTHGIPEALSSLREGRFPSYRFPEAAAKALSKAVQYGNWLRRTEAPEPDLADCCTDRARSVASAALDALGPGGTRTWLDPGAVRDVLGACGIAMPRSRTATTAEEAARAASYLGFPVALKLMSRTITHKSDVGGVALNLRDMDAVRRAFDDMRRRLDDLARGREMDGVLVQEMLTDGVETFVGVASDPVFGRLIGFGIGGVNVEVWKDVAFRVNPITMTDAVEMLSAIRGARLLDGFRGKPAADRRALAELLMRVSRLAEAVPEIVELDVNPLLARQPGRGVVALDARIAVQRT